MPTIIQILEQAISKALGEALREREREVLRESGLTDEEIDHLLAQPRLSEVTVCQQRKTK